MALRDPHPPPRALDGEGATHPHTAPPAQAAASSPCSCFLRAPSPPWSRRQPEGSGLTPQRYACLWPDPEVACGFLLFLFTDRPGPPAPPSPGLAGELPWGTGLELYLLHQRSPTGPCPLPRELASPCLFFTCQRDKVPVVFPRCGSSYNGQGIAAGNKKGKDSEKGLTPGRGGVARDPNHLQAQCGRFCPVCSASTPRRRRVCPLGATALWPCRHRTQPSRHHSRLVSSVCSGLSRF